MPPNALLKQNGPPPNGAPEGVVTVPQRWNPLSSPRAMNMYSPFTLQFPASAHSMPPPAVHVVTVLLPEVEISQLPHSSPTFWHVSMTEALVGTKATPPLAYSRVRSQA